VTLVRARAWLKNQQFASAAPHLAVSLESLRGSDDLGLLVQSHAAYGEALLGLARPAEAEAELRAASSLWASESALVWLRSLPAGSDSERRWRGAADAAFRAVLRIAEQHAAAAELPPPPFASGASPLPFSPRQDSELSPSERAVRQAWIKQQRTAFVRYWQREIPPWWARRRAALQAAEKELEQVYLVPPTPAPEWRVAVAADIGQMWMRFAEAQRDVAESCSGCRESSTLYYGTFDDSWEPDKQRARDAFETCIALSRQHRLLTEYTRLCEHWLARTYKHDYAELDELVPTAHWGAP